MVNLFILYELNVRSRDLNTNFKLGDCLFEATKLTKDAGPDKYGYSGNGIRFYARLQFSSASGEQGKNVAIYGTDNSSSVHADNRNKLKIY